jgi:hypothetical protein
MAEPSPTLQNQNQATQTVLAWWEDFQSTLIIVRTVQWMVAALTLFSVLGIGLALYRFVEGHWGIWNQHFQEETVKAVLSKGLTLMWDVTRRIGVLVGIRLVGWLFMRLPIPDRLLLGWANDPDMRPTTSYWLVNEFKWTHHLSVRAVMRAHELGRQEERGLALIREREGVKALERRASLKSS